MYYVIVNPASKSGKGHAIWTGLEPIFQEQNVPYRVLYSKGVGHVTKAVAKLTAQDKNGKAKPLVKLIIRGGDGTVNEAPISMNPTPTDKGRRLNAWSSPSPSSGWPSSPRPRPVRRRWASP